MSHNTVEDLIGYELTDKEYLFLVCHYNDFVTHPSKYRHSKELSKIKNSLPHLLQYPEFMNFDNVHAIQVCERR